jgi:AcrR family transcriptional regulator
MTDLDTRLRADAQLNRDRVLEVARTALATDPAASLNFIAKTAGVGAGTLYRHFPTREALLVAVYRKEIEDLVALSTRLLAEYPPLQAFLKWCNRLAKAARTKQGIAVALRSAITAEDYAASWHCQLGEISEKFPVPGGTHAVISTLKSIFTTGRASENSGKVGSVIGRLPQVDNAPATV